MAGMRWDDSDAARQLDVLRSRWSAAYHERLRCERLVAIYADRVAGLNIRSIREKTHDEDLRRATEGLTRAKEALVAAKAAEAEALAPLAAARREYRRRLEE